MKLLDDQHWDDLKKIIRNRLLKLEKKGYIIPANTIKGDLFTQNIYTNSLIFIADLICIIITLIGMKERIITFFGIITYSIYTLTEQLKIARDQINRSKNKLGSFKKGKRIFKHMFPPNLLNIIFVSLIAIISCILSINYIFGGTSSNFLYIIIILSSFVCLFDIKVKYMIFDTFGITNWQFVEEEG